MYKEKSKKKNEGALDSRAKWLEAAAQAEKHIDNLTSAVRVFKRNADSREPWPGNEKAETADAIPAITRNTETLTAV